MSLPIRFTPTADVEFLGVIAYIGADRPSAAVAFKNQALNTLSRLSDLPESGRTVPEYPALPFREVIVAPYRFFYQVKLDAVWIVAIWHGAQLADPPENGVGG